MSNLVADIALVSRPELMVVFAQRLDLDSLQGGTEAFVIWSTAGAEPAGATIDRLAAPAVLAGFHPACPEHCGPRPGAVLDGAAGAAGISLRLARPSPPPEAILRLLASELDPHTTRDPSISFEIGDAWCGTGQFWVAGWGGGEGEAWYVTFRHRRLGEGDQSGVGTLDPSGQAQGGGASGTSTPDGDRR